LKIKNNKNYFNMKYETQQLLNRCYEATRQRGCINNTTTIKDFNDKLLEEVREVEVESNANSLRYDKNILFNELADVAAVAFNYIIWLGGDPMEEYEKITIKNEQRAIQVQNAKKGGNT